MHTATPVGPWHLLAFFAFSVFTIYCAVKLAQYITKTDDDYQNTYRHE